MEEGVATNFSLFYTNVHLGNNVSVNDEKYEFAEALVRKLLNAYNVAVKELRQTHGTFNDISAEHISAYESGLSGSECEILVGDFEKLEEDTGEQKQ